MKKIAVVTDTSVYLTKEYKEKNKNLKIITLPLIIDNEKVIDDESKISEEELEKLIKEHRVTTSQPSIGLIEQKWDEYLEEYDFLIVTGISKHLSGIYNTTLKLSKNEKYDKKVYVVDTEALSAILKKELDIILKYIEQEEINSLSELKPLEKEIKKIKKRYKCLLFPKKLDSLIKGGRISKPAAMLANMLKIYPILIIKKGSVEKYGTMKSYLKGIRKQIAYAIKNYKITELEIMMNFDDPKIESDLTQMINELGLEKIIKIKMPYVILVHLGYDTFVFNFWIK